MCHDVVQCWIIVAETVCRLLFVDSIGSYLPVIMVFMKTTVGILLLLEFVITLTKCLYLKLLLGMKNHLYLQRV